MIKHGGTASEPRTTPEPIMGEALPAVAASPLPEKTLVGGGETLAGGGPAEQTKAAPNCRD